MLRNNDLILDTHILIWALENDQRLLSKDRESIDHTTNESNILIPAIIIWEIGMLQRKKKITLSLPLETWIKKMLAIPRILLIPLTPEISIESNNLPHGFHGDPSDEIIIATARILNTPLLTYDEQIINYGKQGHIKLA